MFHCEPILDWPIEELVQDCPVFLNLSVLVEMVVEGSLILCSDGKMLKMVAL